MEIKKFLKRIEKEGLFEKYFDKIDHREYPSTKYYKFLMYENLELDVYTVAVKEYNYEFNYEDDHREYSIYKDNEGVEFNSYILSSDLGWLDDWKEENKNKFVNENFVREFLTLKEGSIEREKIKYN